MSIDVQPSPPLCVGIGEILWDLLPTGKALGGAPANVAAHAVQLGARGAAVSAVGDDADGREILKRVQAMGVDASGIRIRGDLPTGAVDVALDKAGVPTFTIRESSAWDAITMDAALDRLAHDADAVVFGSLAQRDPRSREGISRFLAKVRPGCLKVFDINLRRPFISEPVIRGSLEQADVLKLNDGELPGLAGMLGLAGDELSQLRAIRRQYDLDLVVYTRGDKGSRMISAQREESHPGYPACVVDTVGAGDAFTAAVTVGLLDGMELSRIQDLANRVAVFVCSQPGAVPRLPEELRKDFETYKSRNRKA
jgi:fructokinase